MAGRSVAAPDARASGRLRSALASGLRALGLSPSDAQLVQLVDYMGMLRRWNRVFNLTALDEPEQVLTRHILDSASVLEHVLGPRVLDVGSGAGLPGLVLAVLRPDLYVELLDSSRKRTRFCQQVVSELGLGHVRVTHDRLETLGSVRAFHTIVTRAFGDLERLLGPAQDLGAAGGRLLLMKGRDPGAEIRRVAQYAECVKVQPLEVPGLDQTRNLIVVDLDCARAITGSAGRM